MSEFGKQHIENLFSDLQDGRRLLDLLEGLTGQKLPKEKGSTRVHALNNVNKALQVLQKNNAGPNQRHHVTSGPLPEPPAHLLVHCWRPVRVPFSARLEAAPWWQSRFSPAASAFLTALLLGSLRALDFLFAAARLMNKWQGWCRPLLDFLGDITAALISFAISITPVAK
ncbi:hypothetical protein Celaphus_00010036 [Cervus elaphus hippelaphus]|uniref:Calponin-homology (CH) domain-containing protein n=1 Tax=Cervus elaphus hippelaphus TaxID=46360 RepID=A0A212C0Z6_CEREH|nr:hypothetical protein Celaphus_00010036 [Cervus elaphus hippelaphus]